MQAEDTCRTETGEQQAKKQQKEGRTGEGSGEVLKDMSLEELPKERTDKPELQAEMASRSEKMQDWALIDNAAQFRPTAAIRESKEQPPTREGGDPLGTNIWTESQSQTQKTSTLPNAASGQAVAVESHCPTKE